MHKPVLWMHHAGVAENILGPGKRFVLWTSGCAWRCPGCIEEAHWALDSGQEMLVDVLADTVNSLANEIDGITFSGGDPLFQSLSLRKLIDFLPKDLDKMLYTGFLLEELGAEQREVWNCMDLVVDGRFLRSLHGDHLWRGSSNQRFHSPSQKYPVEILRQWEATPSAGLQVHMDEGEMFFYGIPTPGNIDQIAYKMSLEKISIHDS